MLLEAVHHESGGSYAYPEGKGLRLLLRAAKGDLAHSWVLFRDPYDGQSERIQPMSKWGADDLFDYFTGTVHLSTRRFQYLFLLEDRRRRIWFNEAGFHQERPHWGDFRFPYPYLPEPYRNWLGNAVVYQLIPDRFNSETDSLSEGSKREGRTRGSLVGISDKLDYLCELGINVLYLNPIFKAMSQHRYDTIDYFQVDPELGGEEQLLLLVEECHARKIRVILDGVFNHCGYEFFAFQDVVTRGAGSPYKDWFRIKAFPVRTKPIPNYETFGRHIWQMPKLATDHPAVQDYLASVVLHWVRRADIDGWRLDVADEVAPSFWRLLRGRLDGVKPETALIGEIWHRAAPWLEGGPLDSATNYPLREVILDFFARDGIGVQTFAFRLHNLLIQHSHPTNTRLWTILGTHDTSRILTHCGGDVKRAALALVFQMTFVGAPVIYYGDEVGMLGGDPPECRRPMIWGKSLQNQELFSLYRRLIGIRTKHEALRRGSFRIVYLDPLRDVLGYERKSSGSRVLVFLNNSSVEAKISLDEQLLRDELTESQVHGANLDLPGRSAVVLVDWA